MLYKKPYIHGGDTRDLKNIKLDLSASLSPLKLPKKVKRAYARAFKASLSYPDPRCRELVSAISRAEGVPCGHIICGNGASELIYAFTRAVSPASAVILSPCYSGYSEALFSCESRVFDYPLKENDGFMPDLAGFLSFLNDKKPEAVYLCSPNNPTGRLLPDGFLRETAKWCEENNAYLLSDETFRDLADEKSDNAFLKENDRVFIVKALTKSYSLAGLRVGYALCRNTGLLKRVSEQTDPWSVSVPAQKTALAALFCENYLSRARALIKAERERLIKELEKRGFRVFPSDCNFILFKGKSTLYERLLKEGVVLRRCGSFNGLSDEYYRICVKTKRENNLFLSALKRAEKE